MAKHSVEQTEIQSKLQPKLRMIANGSSAVNAVRAEQSSSLMVTDTRLLEEVEQLRGDDATPIKESELPKDIEWELETAPNAVANIFVEFTDDFIEARAGVVGQTARQANIVTAEVPLAAVEEIARRPEVAFVELGEPLVAPTPTSSADPVGAPAASKRRFGNPAKHRDGKGVLIGLIDVQGFDFAHPDFLDGDGKTRFVTIWDQGGSARLSPAKAGNSQFDYGAEFLKEHLDGAISAAPDVGLPAHLLERQSQISVGSHATHVASIAAGNRGVCPKAYIAGVLIALPDEDNDRRQSFYDSTRVAHAVEYLLEVAHELGDVPVSINISLGTNGHAHDASSAINRWIDSSLSPPGRSVCVAAGNAGQEIPAFEGDIGYVMGRIHTSGKIAARDLDFDLEWLVIGNGVADISENELEIWYGPQDRFAISIRPPGMDWIGPIEPGQFIENRKLRGGTFLSVYNELYHPANGSNYIALYLSPFFHPEGVVGIRAGTWQLRLHGREVRDGRFHAWIERDDPRRLGRIGQQEAWSFPSLFSERSYVDNSSVSSLACGHRIISVANFDEPGGRISITSSQGPTRDDRFKPDVAAPGTDIVAAKGFGDEPDSWVAMSGTSMASPMVAGVVGLMLAVEPRLTAAQIGGIIQRTARPLPGIDFQWRNDAGFGVINPEVCLSEAAMVNQRRDVT